MKKLNLLGQIVLLLTAVSIIILPDRSHGAQYESLAPLLTDLSGWEAEEAEGIDMDMGGSKMVQAMREYTREDKELSAMIMIGSAMMSKAQMQGMQHMEFEDKEAKVEVTTIDGFQVSLHHDKSSKEGTILVALAGSEQQAATFVLHYIGLSEHESLELAKGFSWNKMQQAAQKLM
jgi:hypothetical protein